MTTTTKRGPGRPPTGETVVLSMRVRPHVAEAWSRLDAEGRRALRQKLERSLLATVRERTPAAAGE